MIISVEGPSAAGKTTWAYSHFDKIFIVDEARVNNVPGREASLQEIASFWALVSKARWASVYAKEAETGLVVCDADPFKLHYVWSLWQIGEASKARWRAEMAITRELFAHNELGISDLIFVYIPARAALESHARGDKTRTRPNFDLHAQLAEPLRYWYKAIERLDPERVRWQFPGKVDNLESIVPRTNRSGVDIFDAIMAGLPAI